MIHGRKPDASFSSVEKPSGTGAGTAVESLRISCEVQSDNHSDLWPAETRASDQGHLPILQPWWLAQLRLHSGLS